MNRIPASIAIATTVLTLASHGGAHGADARSRAVQPRNHVQPSWLVVGKRLYEEGVNLVEFESDVPSSIWAKPDVRRRGLTVGVRF